MKSNSSYFIQRIFLIGLVTVLISCNQRLEVGQNEDVVSITNSVVKLNFDLLNGSYSIFDLEENNPVLTKATLSMDEWSSDSDGMERSWNKRVVDDKFGSGLALDIIIKGNNAPDMIFSFIMYNDHDFIAVSTGIFNNTEEIIQLKDIHVLADGELFEEGSFDDSFAMVDGFSGGEPLEYGKRLYSPLSRENALKSRNNILLTFKEKEDRNTIIMGGLTYHDFEKFASIQQSRREELQKGIDGQNSLLAYLNLPDETFDKAGEGPVLELKSNVSKRTWQNHEFRCTETAVSAMREGEIIVQANKLKADNNYYLGFSWWRGLWHGDRKDHRQSVYIEYNLKGIKKKVTLIKDELLPRFDGRLKEDVKQVEIPIPIEAIASGEFNIIFEKTFDNYDNSANDPNAYVSEIWLRDGSMEPLLPEILTDINYCQRPREKFLTDLYAKDPVGRRVEPGEIYNCPDLFYIDLATTDPLIALEQYGQNVKRAQEIELSMYDFPSVCLWYAEQSGYGGSNAKNTTLGAVNEMKIIKDKGFLNYSRAAVRLVPDSYLPVNQQGWWDDEHWQMEETDRDGSENGRYVKPYETSEKWGKAVTDLGGIPLTYFQAGFRSEDYSKAFPGHMLFNKSLTWRGAKPDTTADLFTSWNKTWTRNRRVWGYDYSDPDFLAHLKDVYENLKSGGVKGLMFDYPGYAWSYGGGMEDKYSTTAKAYRNIFRMPYEGLGPGSYVHERNMERGTDVSIGYVASMRTENDTDRMDPTTVTRCGMRWYKNRVLYNQDTDSKNIARLQDDRDVVRSVLTMAYVTTGRLLLANSFDQFTYETYWDITRTFPYHNEFKSARPADAFVSDIPMVYDYEVDNNWHQVTFFNPEFDESKTIGINISGQPVDGALNLDHEQSYHVYDFWNDKYVGKLNGNERLEQSLRPGESRMLSVRQVMDHPQVVSTNRHIMQGYLDMEDVEWNAKKMILSGTSKVVGGDPYVITVAGNGYEVSEVICEDPGVEISMINEGELIKVKIEVEENKDVEWVVKF